MIPPAPESRIVYFEAEPIDWTPRDGGPPWISALESWPLNESA